MPAVGDGETAKALLAPELGRIRSSKASATGVRTPIWGVLGFSLVDLDTRSCGLEDLLEDS